LYYEKESGALNFVAGLAIGAVFGASIALLMAPEPGKRTRRRVVRAVSAARDLAPDDWGEVSGQVQRLIRRGRRRMRR
jgi:gas vesicle protein